jgi:hypothetical protein
MHHDELLFVAFVASISLVTTIKRILNGTSIIQCMKASMMCLIVVLGFDFPRQSTRTLITALRRHFVVGPIPQGLSRFLVGNPPHRAEPRRVLSSSGPSA